MRNPLSCRAPYAAYEVDGQNSSKVQSIKESSILNDLPDIIFYGNAGEMKALKELATMAETEFSWSHISIITSPMIMRTISADGACNTVVIAIGDAAHLPVGDGIHIDMLFHPNQAELVDGVCVALRRWVDMLMAFDCIRTGDFSVHRHKIEKYTVTKDGKTVYRIVVQPGSIKVNGWMGKSELVKRPSSDNDERFATLVHILDAACGKEASVITDATDE